MNTVTPAKVSLLNIFVLESISELKRLIRTPAFSLPTILFPVMFYVFFGVIFAKNPTSAPTYLMITYCVFGIVGPALFSFGVGIAVERGQGWFNLKEVSPMPASAYVISRVVLSGLFAAIIITILFAIGSLIGNVNLATTQWLSLSGIFILGSLPFCAIGLTLGLMLKSNSAAAIINLIYLPMSFLSGLWIPINMMPGFLQQFANVLPPYHLAQLALKVTDMDVGGSVIKHITILVAYSVLFSFLAIKAYYRKNKG
ncbi:ABC transporter permease [Shewanella sp. OPT22]|nr:ABC transporter permease [Shewanella sp. OPT22]